MDIHVSFTNTTDERDKIVLNFIHSIQQKKINPKNFPFLEFYFPKVDYSMVYVRKRGMIYFAFARFGSSKIKVGIPDNVCATEIVRKYIIKIMDGQGAFYITR